MYPLNYMPLHMAAEQIRSGRTRSREIVSACLAAIEKHNNRLNALLYINNNALEEADALDVEAAAGDLRGPLHGIPLVVKDNMDVRGMPTALGSALFAHAGPSPADSGAVAAVRAAGAIILGKANMDELACHVSGITSYFQPTVNPWQSGKALSPGGSSSGTAASVAAGFCLGGLGSDTGGSIRLPSGWCGLAGLRPTHGRVSLSRCYPRAIGLDTIGPLARSVHDAALIFQALAGPGEATPVQSKALCASTLGIFGDSILSILNADVRAAYEKTLQLWRESGVSLTPVDMPLLLSSDMVDTLNTIRRYEFARDVACDVETSAHKDKLHTITATDYENGRKIPYAEYHAATERARDYRAAVLEAIGVADACILPVSFTTALPINAALHEFAQARRLLDLFSMVGVPTLVVPGVPSESGLPTGIQLVGAPGTESALLHLGMAYEERRGNSLFPDPLAV